MSILESVLAFDIFPPAAMIVQHSGRLKEELWVKNTSVQWTLVDVFRFRSQSTAKHISID